MNGRYLVLELRRLYLAEQGMSDEVIFGPKTAEHAPLQFSIDKEDARKLHFHLGAARRHMEIAREIAKENKVITRLALTPDFIKHARAREMTALRMMGDNE